MAAYTEMVNAQLGMLNKQFILILNGRLVPFIYQGIKNKTFSAKYAQMIIFKGLNAVNKQK